MSKRPRLLLLILLNRERATASASWTRGEGESGRYPNSHQIIMRGRAHGGGSKSLRDGRADCLTRFLASLPDDEEEVDLIATKNNNWPH